MSDEEIKTVNPNNGLRAPAGMIRVNKGELDGTFQPKSRLDPHLGSFHSDAPTTTWSAVQLTKSIALTKGWDAACFDVKPVFLSGKPVERRVIITAPPETTPSSMT